jgi:two-component system response regulator NreC
MTIRILIADDHGILRAGLRSLLRTESGLEVVGEADNCEDVQHLADQLQPDVVLMDVSMPVCGGIEATRRLKQRHPEIGALILTVHEDKSLLRAAIDAGAGGYILKRALESELINAIRAVARGDLYVHPSMTRALLEDASRPAPVQQNGLDQLTPRELDVLSLVALGHTNRQIAQRLTLSVRTVESHRANLMAKLGLRSRVELVRYASEQGLLNRSN